MVSDLLFLSLSTSLKNNVKIVLAPSWHLPWHQYGTKRIVRHLDKSQSERGFPQLVSLQRYLTREWYRHSGSNASLCRYLCFRCRDSNAPCWLRYGGSVNKNLNTFEKEKSNQQAPSGCNTEGAFPCSIASPSITHSIS